MAPSEVALEARRVRALSSRAQNQAVSRVASCDALVVAGVRPGVGGGGSETRGSFLRRTSSREWVAATEPWAAVGPKTMRPRGAGCSARLLLAVGWLFLAGFQSACGTNVTAIHDPGLARAEAEGEGEDQGEGEGEDQYENESEAEEEAASDTGEPEHIPPRETQEDGEGGRILGGDKGTRSGQSPALCPRTVRMIPVNVCRALRPTAPNLYISHTHNGLEERHINFPGTQQTEQSHI